jgi:TolB-like protein/Tfp pilus assembly protein PilF
MVSDARTAGPSTSHSSGQDGGNGAPGEVARGSGGNGSTELRVPGNGAARLDSWKEIAAFFDRDIRTVQLWEKKEGLPVYRHEHAGRPTVYAYPAELDAWLRMRTQVKSAPAPAAEREPDVQPARPAESVADPAASPSSAPRLAALILLFVAIALGTGILAVLYGRHRASQREQPPPATGMLAVLPFEDLTPQPSASSSTPTSDFLVDGLTDDLITDLGRGGRLQVISRLSVMQFHGQHASLPAVAAQLHAATVLEGEVAREGTTVRVTARLVDALHDHQLWAETYRRSEPNTIGLQDEIAADIATAVTQALTGETSTVSFDARPVDPQVRIAYLTGRYLWNQRTEPAMRRAIDQFHQAIAIDSGYAPAWAGLADSYNLMAVWGSMRASDAFPQARADAEQALALDGSSAEAWNSLAFEAYRYEWDFAGADADFRKAIAANPNYAVAHQWYGEFLGDLRRFDESIAELRHARDLDPLSAMVSCDLADGYFHAGRFAEARAEAERVLTLYPDFEPAHNYLASIDLESGDSAQAEREAEAYSRLTGDPAGAKAVHIHVEAIAGQEDKARADLHALLATPGGAAMIPYQKAALYFEAGENEAGYAALEQAFQQRSWWLVTLMVDPGFDSVRREPRFLALEKRVGLPAAP